MNLVLLVITDGRRECLEQTIAALVDHIGWDLFSQRIVIDDCPDSEYGAWIDREFAFDSHIPGRRVRRGFAGAIRAGWDQVQNAEFVLHFEDDFVLQRDWDVRRAIEVLSSHPHLAQMALRRQPWNQTEREAGGVVELDPQSYVDCSDEDGNHWLEHRKYFTTNPCLYPAWVVEQGWPTGRYSEGRFSLKLFENPQIVCGLWGQRTDSPWVIHIGDERVGREY